ncbi:MAG TPA: DoxX family protein [Actinophytocola sp.]|jgi:uncharacterized membrane protein YphA (DoxX/SURF4 family)|uniref:DoxX family protein n=1 Tax=Actinophytocola sp. TaxID=1872138 RepID=UPI002DF8FF46|nr:DoxX family protein [Actinophytocola sp.]
MLPVILSALLAPVLLVLGSAKVIRHPMMQQNARHLGFSVSGFQLVGAVELAGGVGLILGLFWTPLGVAASVGLVLLLAGGAFAHARVRDRFVKIAFPAVCAALSGATLVLHLA